MHPSLTTPLAVAVALPALALWSGRRPLAAVNASSHWLWPGAGEDGGYHLGETLVGAATNLAAAAMWGAVMAATLRRTGAPVPTAIGVAAGAALLDYALLPRRLSPGWERALPRGAVAAGFAAMAAGMMLGTIEAEGESRTVATRG